MGKSAIEAFAIFTDERFFQEDVDGYPQFLSLDAAGFAQRLPGFVVDGFAKLCFSGFYGIKVAADGFFPGDLAIVVGLFDAAFDDAFFVSEAM